MTRLQTPQQAADWLRAHVTGRLGTDSRQLSAGDGFIAWPGAARDGRAYVADVLAAGAAVCLVEEAGADNYDFSDERIAVYPDLKAAAAPIAAAYFNEPSTQLQVFAVTGTNGKTSSSWWLAQALGKVGLRCGVVGTLGIGEPGAMVSNGLTTPDPVLLQEQLRRFVDAGFRACALEASSIGIAEKRLDATQVKVAIFTNFTQDHLDYHGSMQAYWDAKKSLFAWPDLECAVVNIDDAKGAGLALALADSGLDVWTVSIAASARLQAKNIRQGANKLQFEVVEGQELHLVSVATVGLYNVSNLLGVIAAMRAAGVSLKEAANSCCGLQSVPGRLDVLGMEASPLVAIDYAHTPDALEKVLLALQPIAQSRGGVLWCVFGCGGDRDASKRPLMAAIAQKNADHLVVTSDNPRSEAPEDIIRQILAGLSSADAADVQADRSLAISSTVSLARPSDVVLIAGKGHENYQEIAGVRYPFSDRAHAMDALVARSVQGVAA